MSEIKFMLFSKLSHAKNMMQIRCSNCINWLLVIYTLLALTSCSPDQCIDADDFGFMRFNVGARYNSDDIIPQFGDEQIAPWRSTGYRVNGRPLTIVVRNWKNGEDFNEPWDVSAWCPWYGDNDNSGKLSFLCSRLQTCQFLNDTMCVNKKYANIINAPCLMKKGVGLYALISPKGEDPNATLESQWRPTDGLVFHLGERQNGYKLYDISKYGETREAGGIVYKYGDDKDVKSKHADGELFFKILDSYYDDNSGQYRLMIKSGITSTSPDPISYLIKLVKEFLFGTDGNYGLIKNVYQSITNNAEYKLSVSMLLTLYVMFAVFKFLTGNAKITQTELIIHVFKIAIVSALLRAEYSWAFFNDYLFVYFIGGVEQILQIITEAGSTGPGSPSILGLMIAPQTMAKLFSLLLIDSLGFVYILLFIFLLYFVVMIFFQAAVIYLSALISIGLIIVMGPIFVCFLLFKVTRSLFENWLKQLFSYAVQPIILFTGLIFISMIIRDEIYGSLGFRVCKQNFPFLGDIGTVWTEGAKSAPSGQLRGTSIFYWWFPVPSRGEQFSRNTVDIPIPIDHFDNEGKLCEAYGCIGPRYIDLPFLDPEKHAWRLEHFWNGKFVHLDGLLLLFAAAYLLHKFNSLSISIAKFITGTSGNLTDIASVKDSMVPGFDQQYMKAYAGAQKTVPKLAARGYEKISTKIDTLKRNDDTEKMLGSKKIYNLFNTKERKTQLKKQESINPDKMDKNVAKQVHEKYGTTEKDFDFDAKAKYRDSVAQKLQDFISDDAKDASKSKIKNKDEIEKKKLEEERVVDEALDKMLKKSKNPNIGDVQQLFAKVKFSKSYSKLSDEEKLEINKAILSKEDDEKSIVERIQDLNNLDAYQSAYAEEALKPSAKDSESPDSSSSPDASSSVENGEDPDVPIVAGSIANDQADADSEPKKDNVHKMLLMKKMLNAIKGKILPGQKRSLIGKAASGATLGGGDAVTKGLPDKKRSVAGETSSLDSKSDSHDLKDQEKKRIPDTSEPNNEAYLSALSEKERELYANRVSEAQARKAAIERLRRQSKSKKNDQEENDITSPEYWAMQERLFGSEDDAVKQLMYQSLRDDVLDKLTNGEDPGMMGEEYMKKHASQEELEHLMVRNIEIYEEVIENDEFISKEPEYIKDQTENFEKIVSGFEEAGIDIDTNADGFKINDSTLEEINKIIEKEQQNISDEVVDSEVSSKKMDALEELQKNLEAYEKNKDVLDKILERKKVIGSAIQDNISVIDSVLQDKLQQK